MTPYPDHRVDTELPLTSTGRGSRTGCLSVSPGRRQFLGEATGVWAAQAVFHWSAQGRGEPVVLLQPKGDLPGHQPQQQNW